MIDSNWKIIYINKACEDIFKYKLKDLFWKNVYNTLVPEEFRNEIIERFTKWKETWKWEKYSDLMEIVVHDSFGRHFPIEISQNKLLVDNDYWVVSVLRSKFYILYD